MAAGASQHSATERTHGFATSERCAADSVWRVLGATLRRQPPAHQRDCLAGRSASIEYAPRINSSEPLHVVDTHLHCWDRDRFQYDWLNASALPQRFTIEDAETSISELNWKHHALFIEADRAPEQAADEVRWATALGTAASRISLIGAIAYAPVGNGAAAALSELRHLPNVVGIRRLLQGEPIQMFESAALREDLRLVGEHGFVFDACVTAPQLPALDALIEASPMTTFVLDHFGKPDISRAPLSPDADWVSNIRRLARHQNVIVKLSGLVPRHMSYAWTYPWVAECLNTFGSERCLLGSDWPVSRNVNTPYDTWFHFVLRELGLDGAEQRAIGHRNAERIYGVSI